MIRESMCKCLEEVKNKEGREGVRFLYNNRESMFKCLGGGGG